MTDFIGPSFTPGGKRVFIKSHSGVYPDTRYHFLSNEARVLASLGKQNFPSPRVLSVHKTPTSISISEEFYSGKTITGLASGGKIKKLEKVLSKLQISPSGLSKRENVRFLFTLVPNLVITAVKSPRNLYLLLNATLHFYYYFFTGSVWHTDFSLCHGELYSDSILVKGKSDNMLIVDWEAACLSDRMLDPADVTRLYSDELPMTDLIALVKKFVATDSQKRKFLCLAIFRTIQTLAHSPKSTLLYQKSLNYLSSHFVTLKASLLGPQKTLYETVNLFLLDLIYRVNKILLLDKFLPHPSIILCYHSIGNSGWRFATTPRDFTMQIHSLLARYQIIRLSDLLKKSPGYGHLAITFDDGYADILTKALPILERTGLTATVFVLGNSREADRSQMENSLNFLSDNQIKTLFQKGWEIGYHTNTHPQLSKITKEKLDREIVSSKSVVEKRLGIKMHYFAYPKGVYSPIIKSAVKKAAFSHAFTVDGGSFTNSDPLMHNRVGIEGNISITRFEAAVSPLGLFVEKIFMRLLQIKDLIWPNKIYI